MYRMTQKSAKNSSLFLCQTEKKMFKSTIESSFTRWKNSLYKIWTGKWTVKIIFPYGFCEWKN